MTVLDAAVLAEGERLLAEARSGDARQQIRAKDWLHYNADALLAAARQAETMREELVERRACLVGAKETCRMIAAVLTNAEGLGDTVRSYAHPVNERLDLIQQAIDNTDAALAVVAAPNEAKQ